MANSNVSIHDAPVVAERPTIAVETFLFTDIEDSTPWARRLGDDRWTTVLADHHRIITTACAQWEGRLGREPEGDGYVFVFGRAADAVAAAAALQRAIRSNHFAEGYVPAVRVGLHSGTVTWSPEIGMTGLALNRTSRIMSAAHGDQIVLSDSVRLRVGRTVPAGTTVESVGAYRLRGFGDETVLLWELVVDERPGRRPLRAKPAVTPRPPVYSTPVVGREAQLDHLHDLVERGAHPLITLVGQGGVGKTRLVSELLARLGDRPSLFVDLSQLDEPSLLTHHLASTLGLATSPLSEPLDQVIDELETSPVLLVLDNFEQVASAADRIEELIARCGCQVVVTSRRPLSVAGEHVLVVHPLPLDAGIDGDRSPAAQLFGLAIEREPSAGATDGPMDDTLIDRICERVDGLPLAIELAAARLPLMGAAGLLAGLDDPLVVLSTSRTGRPMRHRSISDTIAWSFELLPHVAKEAFLSLAVLPGGCTVADAPSVCGLDAATALDSLETLVDAQLIIRVGGNDRPRCRLPRLIREFGLAELRRVGQLDERRSSVAGFLIELAALARSTSHSRGQASTLQRIDDELDNIRALLGWGVTTPSLAEPALQIAAELVSYWWARHPDEGLGWLRRLVDANPDSPSRFLARAQVRVAFLASWRGDVDTVIDYATRGIDSCRATERRSGTLSMGLHLRAMAWASFDDPLHWSLAREALSECEAIDRTLAGSEQAIHQTNVADVHLADDQRQRAEALYIESLETLDAQGDAWFRAAPMSRLGEIALRRGDLRTARRLIEESATLWRESGSQAGSARALAGLARVARAEGRIADSTALATEAWWVMTETRSMGEAPWVLASVAAGLLDSGDPRRAVQLLGASVRLGRTLGRPIERCVETELADVLETCAAALDTREFEHAWEHHADDPPSMVLRATEALLP